MDRYENLRHIRQQLRELSSQLGLAKLDFEATEFELVELTQDSVDDAVNSLDAAMSC